MKIGDTCLANGENIRDWLFVEDHVSAIDKILHNGKLNNTYNVGGLNEWKNIDLIKLIIKITDKHINKKVLKFNKIYKDRPDMVRYAIDSSKLKQELNWMQDLNRKRIRANNIVVFEK